MRIAVIGWGSLVWNTDCLRVEADEQSGKANWHKNGPKLPVEFMRISNDGRLTLVLADGVRPLPTYWALSDFGSLPHASRNLHLRETGTYQDVREVVGYVSLLSNRSRYSGSPPDVREVVRRWLAERGLDAAIWTEVRRGSKANCTGITDAVAAVKYLRGLTSSKCAAAEKYVRMSPVQIQTDFRRQIEQDLGWQCQSSI